MAIKGALSQFYAAPSGGGSNPYTDFFGGFNDRLQQNAKFYQQQDQQKAQQQAAQALADRQKQSQPQSNFLTDALGTVENLAKPVGQGGINLAANIGQYGEKVLHTGALVGASLEAAHSGLNKNPLVQQGLLNQLHQSVVPQDVASGKANPVQFASQVAQAGLEGAQYVAPVEGLGADVLYAAGRFFLPNAFQRIAAAAGGNAALGGSQNALQQLNETGKIDPGQVAGNAALAGGLGALGTLGGIAGKGATSRFAPASTGKPSLDGAVQQADQIVNGSDVIKKQLAATADAKNADKYGAVQKSLDDLRRGATDPFNLFAREDRSYAKATKQTIDHLVANDQSLTKLVGDSLTSGLVTDSILKQPRVDGLSVASVIKKYGEDTPKGQAFNNYALNLRALDELNVNKPNAKADATGKVRPGYTKQDLQSAIAEYQRGNPNAARDAQVLKKNADAVIDYGVKTGVLDKKFADTIKETYKNYVPLDRVFSEDLVKPQVSGGLRNVSKQKIIQDMVGSNRAPSLSFGASVDYASSGISQALKNKVSLEILRRQQEGNFKGDLLIDPELTKQGRDLRDLQSTLVDTSKGLVQERRGVQADKRVSTAQFKQRTAEQKALQQKAIGKTKELLTSIARKGDNQAFGDVAQSVKTISDKSALQVFDAMANYSPKKLSSVLDRLSVKDAQIGKIRDDIEQFAERNQQILDENKAVKGQRSDTFQQLSEIHQDPVTNENVWTGLKDGERFSISMSPEWASAVQSLSSAGQKNLAESALRMTANVQKTVFTGWAAPVFTLVNSGIKNPQMMFTNAKGLSPFGIRALTTFVKPNKEFLDSLQAHGAIPENFTQTYNDSSVSAMKYAAEGLTNAKGKAGLFKTHPGEATKEALHSLSAMGAFFGNRQRAQIAKGSYINATRRGATPEQATRIAANDYNEVLGNFNRVSRFAKDVEPLLLYSGATQAGIRSTLSAAKQRPAEFALKATAGATALTGMAYLSMSTPAGQQYYQDMKDNHQMYNIENYITYVAPWANKDSSGKWQGVWRLPVVPDFRPVNKAINEQVNDTINGKGIDPGRVATAAFNYITGNFFANTSDGSGLDPQAVLKNNPVAQTGFTLAGRNVDTGQAISANDANATGAGKFVGGLVSPLVPGGVNGNQGDQLLNQLGFGGQVAKGKKGDVLQTGLSSLATQFTGPQGTQTGVGDKVTAVVNSRQTISTQITDALKANDFYKADKLANDFNSQVDDIKSYVSQSSTRKLTDKQVKLLDGLKVPTVAGSISPSSVQSRLKASTNP